MRHLSLIELVQQVIHFDDSRYNYPYWEGVEIETFSKVDPRLLALELERQGLLETMIDPPWRQESGIWLNKILNGTKTEYEVFISDRGYKDKYKSFSNLLDAVTYKLDFILLELETSTRLAHIQKRKREQSNED